MKIRLRVRYILLTIFTVSTIASAVLFAESLRERCCSRKISEISEISDEKYLHRCDRRPKVVVYNRVPKAGSSTTIALLKKLSKKNGFTLHLLGIPYNNYTRAHEAIKAALRRPGRTLICDHFAYPEILQGKEIVYINLLREPVSRIVSQYYYLRYGDRSAKAKRMTIEEHGSLTLDECIQLDLPGRSRCLGATRRIEVG